MRSLLLPVLLVAAAGCYIDPNYGYYRPPAAPPPVGAPPPAAAPAPRLLSEREAVDVAGSFAASRGLQVERVTHAHLDGAGRWHVELRGRDHDRAKVLVDARTGRILKARLKDGRKHGHEREDEDEDDDD